MKSPGAGERGNGMTVLELEHHGGSARAFTSVASYAVGRGGRPEAVPRGYALGLSARGEECTDAPVGDAELLRGFLASTTPISPDTFVD
jgi:hypothetical protein